MGDPDDETTQESLLNILSCPIGAAELIVAYSEQFMTGLDRVISTIVVSEFYYRRNKNTDMTMQRALDSESTTSFETPSVPSELTSPRAKLVYLFLSANGETTLSELQSALNMQKLSLYSILSTLRERELIDQQAERYIVDN